jgi:hypothetical protein
MGCRGEGAAAEDFLRAARVGIVNSFPACPWRVGRKEKASQEFCGSKWDENG